MRTEYEKDAVEAAILKAVRESNDDVPWVVAIGKDAVSGKLNAMITLLEAELDGDEERLLKSLRVVRESLMEIYRSVERKEFISMVQCGCLRSGKHLTWPSYAVGCFSQLHEQRPGGLAGRLWDTAEFVRTHDDYKRSRLVGSTTIGALKTFQREFVLKEESLTRALNKAADTEAF